ncbi:TlyA family RNA methyltransferase [Ancylothrix sp. C2]|uniref:TlyA family RNA methyltransferase n=1 Tax=Ancylothrix sp. D3o TaxID=2953691 RepID=UPI0021BA4FD5|nr:TlyA family RNA methyltransferase [Ancylothrix sp. D3o]MCT7950165.1 TlyA family RNA methyltransferase [Ancylothrix sp. D3o]
MAKQRLDSLLVERGLCASRQLAQRLIGAGEVMVNQQVIDKPGTAVDVEAKISIKERSRFVSRGGEKLAKALEVFAIKVQDRICLDGGISTGGFTDCLLQAGAKLVYGIDVGYGQVDWRIRTDERVILRERTNLRHLTKADLYGIEGADIKAENLHQKPLPDLGVVDVSFISLTKILPALLELLAPPKELILLVKPQFEVGKEKIGKKGVVRDADAQAFAIQQVLETAKILGWEYRGLTFSPITGPAGNIEYLLWLGIDGGVPVPVFKEITKAAQKQLKTADVGG